MNVAGRGLWNVAGVLFVVFMFEEHAWAAIILCGAQLSLVYGVLQMIVAVIVSLLF